MGVIVTAFQEYGERVSEGGGEVLNNIASIDDAGVLAITISSLLRRLLSFSLHDRQILTRRIENETCHSDFEFRDGKIKSFGSCLGITYGNLYDEDDELPQPRQLSRWL